VISRLQLLRNIGQFDNVSTPATLDLKRLTLIYAENGRGKTTLAAILRSLGSGEALPITERRRLGAAHPPEVIAAGMDYVPGGVNATANANCPFCQRELEAAQIFAHYRAYFGEAYRRLQTELAATQTRLETTLTGDALAGFERQISTAEQRRRFWSSLCTVPAIELDATAIASAWQAVRNGLSAALRVKRADPLTAVLLNEDTQRAVATYATVSAQVAEKSRAILAANENIQRVKEATQGGNVQATEYEGTSHTSDCRPLHGLPHRKGGEGASGARQRDGPTSLGRTPSRRIPGVSSGDQHISGQVQCRFFHRARSAAKHTGPPELHIRTGP
jgi:hypothetical protein